MIKLKEITCVIFDLDDTLYDQRLFLVSAFLDVAKYASKESNINHLKIHNVLLRIVDTEGSGCGDIFDKCLRELGIYDVNMVKKMIDIFNSHKPTLAVYDDVVFCLKTLKFERMCRLGMITDGNPMVQRNKIDALNIKEYFDIIIYSDEFGREYRKPSTVPYETVLKRLKISADKTIFVGDNPHKDFIGAKKLGIHTVRIRRGEYARITLNEEYEAEISIKNMNELLDLLQND